jgi:hypothetical protein
MIVWMSESDVDTDFYEIRVTTDHPLDDETAAKMFRSIGYAFRKNLRGESMGQPVRIASNRWTASYDVTKSASDDWLARLSDAVRDATEYVTDGTPPRKTQGGTRLNEGIGPISIKIEFR